MKSITHFDGAQTLDAKVNVVEGTDAADNMVDTAGADSMEAGAGDDTLDSSLGGSDTLLGGSGDDTITIERAEDHGKDVISVDGGSGDDTITFTGNASNKVTLHIDAGIGADVVSITDAFGIDSSGVGSDVSTGAGDDSVTVAGAQNITIDAGSGLNTIIATGLTGHDNFIFGGQDVDTVTVSAADHVVVHTAGGDDVVTASAESSDARVGISTGDGNDSITLDSDNDGHYRLRLGAGQDSVHQNAATDPLSEVKLVFWDFEAGSTGDSLDLGDYLGSVISHHHKGDDLFADGHLRLVDTTIPDGRTAAVLELDMDGTKNGENWVKLAVFVGVDAADLTSDNLVGLDPTVTASPSDPFAV